MPNIREERNKQYLEALVAKMIGEMAEKAESTIEYNIMMGYMEDPSEEE